MLRIRLQRHGSTHAPIYRIVVCERTSPRDGRFVEIVGTYNPSPSGKAVALAVKLDRVDYWTKCGAQPSETVRSLIKRARKEAAAAAAATPAAEPAAA
ncbi:MAG: 30S ribosomal protein S16 [Opitutae bacterium]|nr:30S ribosomal protein S16 [Opitutae bacterium]MCD8298472.1 30S ribosomal protein S16 [Opitutae bacterium]